MFEIYGEFEARITKPSKLADYLPVTFDEFEGCTLKATYHSTILEFKFIKQEDDEDSGYYDFWSYMEAITLGCKYPLTQSKRPTSADSTATTGTVSRRSSQPSKKCMPRLKKLLASPISPA